MKKICWMGIFSALFVLGAWAQSSKLQQADKLSKDGNHREAADAAKAMLTPGAGGSSEDRAKALDLAIASLKELDAEDEAGQVIEKAAADFARDWRVLLAAAENLGSLESDGVIVDDQFIRGDSDDRGRHVSTEVRDRVRQLQLLDQARRALPADAAPADRKLVLEALGSWYSDSFDSDSSAAWQLLALTDLAQLPDYDSETGLDEPAGGYPVDPDGNAIFFKTPATWEAAANDGERLQWIIAEWTKVDTASGYEARQAQAELAAEWFGVRGVAQFIGNDSNDDEAQRRQGIAALHTLKDEETVAHLATGPKRISLPPGWAFLNLYRALAEDADAPKNIRFSAWQSMADELADRRQFGRAAETLEKALPLAADADEKTAITRKIKQIRGNLGRFESQAAQPAGREAKLSLVFRNAQKINLTARKVNITKLLADTEAYLRSAPQEMDWQETQLQAIGQRLMTEKTSPYLGEVAARWEQELKPREDHWDRRVEVATPLKAAGAWYIEGTFEGGHVARAVLWIEDLVIVQTNQAGAGHYFLADAVTGAPIPGAAVKFFGWRQEWKDSRLFQQKPRYVFEFRDQQTVTNPQGETLLSESKAEGYQWLITATTKDGRQAHMGFENFWFGSRADEFGEQTRLYTITDRPVYRPGQEVKWKAWARTVGYGLKFDTNRFKGANIQVEIGDPRGEKVLEKTYKADDSGAIGDTLALGPEATLGQYRVSMIWKRALRPDEHLGSHEFRVEEYKKPEFEVKVDAPTIPVALGDTFEVKVKADYYFGGPVKEGKVKYKVQRTAFTDRWFPPGPWDWLFGAGYNWRGGFMIGIQAHKIGAAACPSCPGGPDKAVRLS